MGKILERGWLPKKLFGAGSNQRCPPYEGDKLLVVEEEMHPAVEVVPKHLVADEGKKPLVVEGLSIFKTDL